MVLELVLVAAAAAAAAAAAVAGAGPHCRKGACRIAQMFCCAFSE